jgi:hypothetical protein
VPDVGLDRLRRHEQSLSDSSVGQTLGHQTQHFTLAWRQVVERRPGACTSDQPRNQLWIHHDSSVTDAANRVGELSAVEHAVFEEVAAALLPAVEQPQRVLRVGVLGQDEDADPRSASADGLGGDESLVRVRRRHANVDDANVGRLRLDRPKELFAGGDLGRNLEVLVRQQA